MEVPHIIILAGPNGAGKTTSQPFLMPPPLPFVNADNIARDLRESGQSSGTQADMAAGRLLITQLDALTREQKSFCVETNLASKTLAQRLPRWQAMGYRVLVFFCWLPSADLAVARVRLRVSAGGHDIPEDTIRRRFEVGLHNLHNVYAPLADGWQIIDSSRRAPAVVERHWRDDVDTPLARAREQTEQALKTAVQTALHQHKAAGRMVPVWRNDTVVWMAPEDVQPQRSRLCRNVTPE